MITVAIDPGEKHCGVAWLTTTRTFSPVELEDWLVDYLGDTKATVVVEEYRLYPWLLQQQGFSEVSTVKVIGVVEHLCRRFGWTCELQPASIKKPTFGIMAARGVKLLGRNQHERDAEAHLYHYRVKQREI